MAFDPLILTTSLALAGVVAAIFLVLSVRKYPKGNEKMIAIWKAIREGSNAYLKRQFRTIVVIAIIIALVIVVGGGPGGLSAAVTMAQKGLKVKVFEKKKVLGKPVRCGE